MAECPSCRRPLPEGASFCPQCGAPLAAPPAADAHETAVSVAGDDTAVTAEASSAACADASGSSETLDDTGASEASGETGPTAAIDDGAEAAETHVLPRAGRSWTCSSCGTEATADDAFCTRCGARRPDEEPTVLRPVPPLCTACGMPFPEGADFCPHCGARRGDVETAASRDQTAVAPAAGGAAYRPAPQAPPPPLPPGAAPPPQATQTGPRSAVPVIALAAIMAVATVAFCVWWFVGRPTVPTATQDFVARVTPVLRPVAAAQRDTDAALSALKAASGESFAAARAAGTKLGDILAAAQDDVDGLALSDDVAAQLDKLRAALTAHVAYAQAVAALPADPASLTAAAADAVAQRANAAAAAYASLGQAAPGLPSMTFAESSATTLSDVAAQVERAGKQHEAATAYLQTVVGIFPDSADARTQAEDILAQMENADLPADNAAAQMQAQSDALKAVLTRIDGLTPPEGQAAQQIQNRYHEAVQHWVSAARLYARWMKTVWNYYQVQGTYPQPGEGIEADTFLSPDYDAAQGEQELADAARTQLAEEVDTFAAGLGIQMSYDASSM